MRVVLTRRALEDPIHGQCGVCFESRRLQEFVVLGADELAICHGCYDAGARFGRPSGGHAVLVDLEQSLPLTDIRLNKASLQHARAEAANPVHGVTEPATPPLRPARRRCP